MTEKNVQSLAYIVGNNIALTRKRKGMTQAELAEKLEMSAESLSRIENGTVAPRFPRIQAMAQALGCSVADLFRSLDDSADTRAASISDMLRSLPAEKQEEVVELVRRIVMFGHSASAR